MKFYEFFRDASTLSIPKQLCRVMRITAFILLAFLIQVSASSKAQISLNLKQQSMRKALKDLSKQSGYDFIYADQDISLAKPISLNLNNVSLEKALQLCFADQPLVYEVSDKTVMIKRKEKSLLDRALAYFTTIDVKGVLLDAEKRPLVGANIIVRGTTKAVRTNEKGEFYLQNIEEDAVLVITYIGYQTKEVKVSSNMGQIILTIANDKLDEVVVNAGYYSVKESERTGSIARITSKDIETQPVTNVLATMQGRMAGVEIIQDGGTAGGGFQIRVRGLNSLRQNGNELLYIVDGVPYSSESIGSSNVSRGTATPTSPLNSINPSDIESVEVLKDADATAIYGSRGSNGVVLITTKKGKAGKTKLTVNAASAIGKVTKMVKLMNTEQYLAMRRQAFANDGAKIDPDLDYDLNGAWDQNRYTNWQDVLMGGTANINNLQASVSGGSEQTQFLLSGMYRTETTVLPGNFAYDKGAVHLNMSHNSQDKKFRLVFSSGYTFQNNIQAETDVTRVARNMAPNAPALYNPDRSLNFQNSTFQNPLAALLGITTAKVNDLMVNTVLSYQLMPKLTFKTNLGFTNLSNNEQRLLPSTMYDPMYQLGSEESIMYLNLTTRQSWIIEPQLNWKHEFKYGKIEALAGATLQQQRSSYLYMLGTGFASNSLITNIASATKKSVDLSDKTNYKYQAFFARLNYNLADKYIVNLTARRDGSSRFGPDKQFAIFGAVGAAWLFSKEKFLNRSTVLSFGKLRMSYGTAGSDQIGDYQFLNTYTSSKLNYQGVIGLDPTRLYNRNFGWESNKKFETALETGFLKDRIFLTTAWYRNRSSNQLVGIPLPNTTGFSSINANLDAVVQNTGVEFTLRTVNLEHSNFSWTSNLNLSAAKNKLISFPGLSGSTYSNRYVIGESISIAKRYRFTGLNKQTGLYEVADVNNDGIITAATDKKTIVNLNPDYFGGIQNEFRYRKWHADFLFQFVKQRVEDYNPYVPGGSPINQRAELANAWQKPGDNAMFQQHTTGSNNSAVRAFYNYFDSDAMIVDGSYIRLKNISLSYDLMIPMLKDSSCKISLQGQNILTFTAYKGGDPEFKYTGYLPPLRVYNASIQITF